MSEDASALSRSRRYSTVAIALHWLIAVAMAFQLALGFSMPEGQAGFAAYQLHKSIGIAILLLTLARLLWRIFRRPPAPVERGPAALAAKLVHLAFYAVLILGPLTGWALVSTAAVRVPTRLFGTVPWPHLPLPSGLNGVSTEAHEVLAWIAIVLIAAHVAGALRHHFLLRDGMLARMAPGGSPLVVGALALLMALVAAATPLLVGTQPADPVGRSLPRVAATTPSPAASASPETSPSATPSAAPSDATPSPTPDTNAVAPPPAWTIQPGGRLGFAVANGDDRISGSFAKWSGTIVFDPDHPESADISISVDLASASVGDATQDDMLAGPDFLAASAGPRATWRATSVRSTGPGRYAAQGTLSLKGASRPQPLTFTLSGTGARRSVRGSATIDRTAFGVGSGATAENLAPKVSLDFAFDAVRKPG